MSSHGRDSGFNPSSPHSSSAKADSYKHEGTPDTRLTTFSPEGDGSVRSTKYFGTTLVSASDPQPNRFPGKPSVSVFHPTPGSQNTDKDPFVATHPTINNNRDPRLSATANDFQPFSLTSIPTNSSTAGQTSDLNHLLGPHHHGFPQNADGYSSDKGLSRYIVVETRPHAENLEERHINSFFNLLKSNGITLKGKHWVSTFNGKLYFRFSNILDAWLVQANARSGGPNWQAANIRPDVWQLLNPDHTGDLEYEGRVILVVVIGPDCTQSTDQVEQTVRNMLNQQAEIFCFLKQSSSTDGSLKILIEFCDVDAAALIIGKYHNFSTDGITLYLTLNKGGSAQPQPQPQAPRMPDIGMGVHTRRPSGPDLSSLFHDMTLTTHPAQQQQGSLIAGAGSSSGHMAMSLAPSPMGMYPPMGYGNQLDLMPPQYMLEQFQSRGPSPYHIGAGMPPFSTSFPFLPPSNTTTLVPYNAPYQHDYIPRAIAYRGQPDSRRQNAMRVNRASFFNASGHHNHVDINRIRDGVDVRSTIMLRNIPNKVDQAMLKDIIDQSSWGKYDFMYLRIDFANDCNVGYAFINFVDPLDIIDFVRMRGNQRWNCFKSDKIAEISYATIQGKDCLVSKFRNSSVMLEPPHYRPKLYYTTNGPHPELAGNEEPFPGPDNQSKMKRSCENAEHVGLFTPNAGAHIRDEQRRRRSQFDRGTRHAALEEFENQRYYIGQQEMLNNYI